MNPHEVVVGEVERPLCGARGPFGNRGDHVRETCPGAAKNNPKMKDFWSAYAESTIRGCVESGDARLKGNLDGSGKQLRLLR
jgi:hypothetical protein